MAKGMSESDARAMYGDYGHFQMNQNDVNDAIKKYGLDPDKAKHLYGGGPGGKSTPQEQTRAMHEYMQKRYPDLYDKMKSGDPKAYEEARQKMKGMWFGLNDSWNKKEVQDVLGGKTTPGMLGDGAPSLGKSATMGDLDNAKKHLEGQLAKAPDADKSTIQKQLDQINGLKQNLSQQRQQKELSQTVNGNPETAAVLAESMKGLHEVKDRQVIREYLKNGGHGLDPATTAWCADFINSSLSQAGIKGSGSDVANSFQKWGSSVDDPNSVRKGDVLVEHRGLGADETGGHVGMSTGKTRVTKDGRTQIEMLGGNQSNSVSTKWTDADKLMIRRATTPEFEKKVKEYEQATGKKAFEGGARSNEFKSWLENKPAGPQPNQPQQPPNSAQRPAAEIVPPAPPKEAPKANPQATSSAAPSNPPAEKPTAQSPDTKNSKDGSQGGSGSKDGEEPKLEMPPTKHSPDKSKGGPVDVARGPDDDEDSFNYNA